MRSKGEKPEKTMKIFPNFRPGARKSGKIQDDANRRFRRAELEKAKSLLKKRMQPGK